MKYRKAEAIWIQLILMCFIKARIRRQLIKQKIKLKAQGPGNVKERIFETDLLWTRTLAEECQERLIHT